MTKTLTSLNQFTQGESRVWYDASKGDIDFGYSDGQEIEQRLKAILTQAEDLSCTSYELKSYITDWPTEYHLTPVRSNLIRALNLQGVKRVLELGCGCGSITRYLGDYQHAEGSHDSSIQVDSVEGSPIRAELAALRCRDLNNVTISTANFNQIEFPEDYYDLVLYVGVTEYAGRFSDGKSDTEALQDLLALAKKAAKKDGVVMVAIENRTGMKYVQGANEDHYAKPYIGVHNYAQPAGIRTYTKGEWQEQIVDAGFSASEFIYPFPDYKIPTIFLAEDYVDENPYSFNHLEGCRSRDYVEIFEMASRETLFWESAAATKTLGEYANSFMILMSNNAHSVAQMSQNDFLHLPTYDRKLPYCMAIAKPKGQEQVQRSYLVDDAAARQQISSDIQHQQIMDETFHRGSMLSVEWSRSLISYRDLNVFKQFLRDYFDFLLKHEKSGSLTIDLLPANIVVDPVSKGYLVVDEEWQVSDKLTAEFIFFRAILFFYMTYPDFVEQRIVQSQRLHTLEDLLRYAFSVLDRKLDAEQLLAFAEQNSAFQNAISSNPVEIDFQEVLAKIPSYTSLHWKQGEASYQPDQFVKAAGNGRFERETFAYTLPSEVRSISGIQFSPSSHVRAENNAFFRVYRVALIAKNNQGEKRQLWSLDDESKIASQAQLHALNYNSDGAGSGFYVLGASPCMAWDIEADIALLDNEHLICEIEARYPLTEHGQQLVERSAEVFALQAQLEALQHSRAYHWGQKLARVVGLLRRVLVLPKRILVKLLSLFSPKKKVAKKTLAMGQFTGKRVSLDKLDKQPLVSIIIPFRDEPALLETCVSRIAELSTYQNYEIVAVSNDSVSAETQQLVENLQKRYSQFCCIEHNIPFNFSALVNAGVAAAKGDYLLLLNNDVEICSGDWLERLLGLAMAEKVAAVGGLLEYQDGRIQHLGLHINEQQLPVHSFKGIHTSQPGVQPLLNSPRQVTAITGALLMVSREIWEELQGFAEQDLGVAFNDVDFCLRAIELGYQNVIDPQVRAIHIESHSRGYETSMDRAKRFQAEQQAFIQRHQAYVSQPDPYCSQSVQSI